MAIKKSPSKSSSAKWPMSWFVLGTITIIIEFVLKYLAYQYRLNLNLIDIPSIVSFNIVYVLNRYSAFGMMSSVPDWFNQFMLLVSVIFLIGLTIHQMRSPDSTVIMRRGIFCFIIGAIGNMVDRLILGGVVDYIDFRIGQDGSFYALAWNISDLVINVGFAHIMMDALKREDAQKKNN